MSFKFRPFKPPPQLAGLVRQSFFAEGRIPYRTDKILPNGVVPLVFTLKNAHRVGKSEDETQNDEFSYSWLSGLQTTPHYHTPLDGTHVLGILFEPPGLYCLFGTDMRHLRDRTVDGLEILPDDFFEFAETIALRAHEPAAHDELFHWLRARKLYHEDDWLIRFCREILVERGAVDLEGWYLASGHSARHAVNLFRRGTGVTPKVLCRIHRLIALLEAVDPTEDVNWTELAHEYGFFDQAHFNHEFRRLSGLFPSEYLSMRRRDLPELGKGDSVSFAPQR